MADTNNKSSHIQTKQYTLVFPYNAKNTHVLLGLKKRGFGVGKWNGFGGKVKENESINACAARELKEECGIEDAVLKKKAILFLTWEESTSIIEIHVYKATQFHSEPIESEEMKPQWFSVDPFAQNHIPYDKMWEEARIWYQEFQKGQKFILYVLFKGNIDTPKDGSSIINFRLIHVEDIYNYTYADYIS
ncbi:uncharacterized protein T551_00345 [Pneumocystis jirovecii RU7]|uniref:Oxidized purine nucleoside triphosphate hydrolase n=1 Tax=Pneumocystis jirovecii (strain RU7) TaxID=1408657 RepID=A0A0W4ZV53_PNEJ7|nr:uncharacterized protein T551_00345 [Pneumocystis jirovecii RU7]KTW32254.1 hypothetical protein T551_00345 [Pneumocystis jirovecii RU7]